MRSEATRTSQLRDPVHGYIDLSPVMKTIIDTRCYQRLRDIKQMGNAFLVFPSAIHTRFEHCLGTAHLARKFARHLKKTQPELEISDTDVQNVTLAGLVHDLGHGPHSHMFSRFVVPRLNVQDWTHEHASVMLFEAIVDSTHLDLPREDVRRVGDLIQGNRRGEKVFLFDIVANNLNSVDVDKFDYLSRDKHYLGETGYSTHFKFIRNRARAVGDTICYHQEAANYLYALLWERFSMFQLYYTHEVSTALELMHADALLQANHHYHFDRVVQDPLEYMGLTDYIFREIENSEKPELAASRELMQRVKNRTLYKLAGEVHVPPQAMEHWSHLTESELITSCTTSLQLEDLEICPVHLTWAREDIQHKLLFFNDDSHNPFEIPLSDVRAIMPAHHSDYIVRVYAKNLEKFGETQKAFQALLKRDSPATTSEHFPAE